MQQRHTFYELREQYIAEQYWPVGEPAETLRAILIGKMIANRISYDARTQADIKRILEKLYGEYEPKEIVTGVTKGQMKRAFGL